MAIDIEALVANALRIAVAMRLTVPVSREPYTGEGSYGNPAYGTAVTHNVLLEDRVRHLGSDQLAQQATVGRVTFLETVAVKQQDRITLPDGRQPAIQSVEGVTLPDGRPVTVVSF